MKKKSKIWCRLFVLGIAVVFLAGIANAQDKDKIVIGQAIALSGPLAGYALLVEAYRSRRDGAKSFGVCCDEVEDFSPFAIAELTQAARDFEGESFSIQLLDVPEEVMGRMHESAIDLLVS